MYPTLDDPKGVWRPASGSTPGTAQGWAFHSAGSVSHPSLATASLQTQSARTEWDSTNCANLAGGIVSTTPMCWRGNAARLGGFMLSARFSISANPANSRAFVGVSASSTNVCVVDPSTVANTLGMGFDSGDSSGGFWYLIMRDSTTGQKIILDGTQGAAQALRNTTDVYDLVILAKPNSSSIYVRISNLSASETIYNRFLSSLTHIPATDALLYVHASAGIGSPAMGPTRFDLYRLDINSVDDGVYAPAGTQPTLQLLSAGVITQGLAAQPDQCGLIQPGTTSLRTRRFVGVAFEAASSRGQTIGILASGMLDPAIKSLGPGVACGVGVDVNGNLVRATDPACASAPNWVGDCDTNGNVTIAPRRGETFNVLDFGAVGDGVTDDTAAIFAATKSAAASLGFDVEQPGGIVQFSPGAKYNCASGMVFDTLSNVTWRGPAQINFSGSALVSMEGIHTVTVLVSIQGIQTVTVAAVERTYTRSAGSYITDGFVIGMLATFSGFINSANNGVKTITAVTATVLTVSDAGLVDEALVSGTRCVVESYTRSAGNYITDGFVVGMLATFGGFTNPANNGTKTITAVTPTYLTVSDAGLVHEASVAETTSAGCADFIRLQGCARFAFEDLVVTYSNPRFLGRVFATGGGSVFRNDCSTITWNRCTLYGSDLGIGVGFNNHRAAALISLDQTIVSRIRDCSFTGARVGVRGQTVSYSNAIVIEGCAFARLIDASVYQPGQGWYVAGNTFEPLEHVPPNPADRQMNAVLQTLDYFVYGFTFIGNWVGDGRAGFGSWITLQGLGICIQGNFISGSDPDSVIKIGGSDGLIIAGNRISGSIDFTQDVTGLGNFGALVAANSHQSNTPIKGEGEGHVQALCTLANGNEENKFTFPIHFGSEFADRSRMSRFMTGTFPWTPGLISAGGYVDSGLQAVNGALLGDAVDCGIRPALPAGVIGTVVMVEDGRARVTIQNITNSPVTLAASTVRVVAVN